MASISGHVIPMIDVELLFTSGADGKPADAASNNSK